MRSTQAAALAGITYRQLDYLTRRPGTPLDQHQYAQGSGSRRQWNPHHVILIALAQYLTNALPIDNNGHNPLPAIAFALLDTTQPIPPKGWLACLFDPDAPPTIRFAADPYALADALIDLGAGAVVAYDLHRLLAGRLPGDQFEHGGSVYPVEALIEHVATEPVPA